MAERIAAAMEVDPSDSRLKINSEKADKILLDTQDPSRMMSHLRAPSNGSAATGQVGAYESVKTDAARVKLEDAQLDLAQRKGELLSRKEVETALSACGQIIRDNLKSNSRRLAEKFSTMNDPREIRTVMEEENNNLLRQISDDFLRRIPAIKPGEGQ